MREEIPVTRTYLDIIAEKIACGTLDMHEPSNSSAETFIFRGKSWIATGGMSSGVEGQILVDIREVIPDSFWNRPYNDTSKRGDEFYLGGRFFAKGNRKMVWVMTENKCRLVPGLDEPEKFKQGNLL